MTAIVIPPPIDALPPAPSPTDTPSEFDSKAFAHLAAQAGFVAQANAAAAATNQNATAAQEQATASAATAASAALSATSAEDSAINAATRATAALASQNASATSAADSEASRIAASKLNLGNKAAPPAADNQGAALLAGATYYDTTLTKWRVWTGAAWGDGINAVAGVSSINGLAGDLTGFVTETGVQSLTNKELLNPILTLGGSEGAAGQVPVSQGAGLPPVWGSVESLGSGGATATGSVVLTAASPAMQSVTPTGCGQSVTLPDATTLTKGVPVFGIYNAGRYPLLVKNNAGTLLGFVDAQSHVICSLAANGAADGEWDLLGSIPLERDVDGVVTFASSIGVGNYLRSVALDATRTMLLLSGNASVHAVVFDHSANVFGAPSLVRTADVRGFVQAALQTTDRVLVATCNQTTGMEAVILSVSGTTITVNTAATATLAGSIASMGTPESNGLIAVGSSFIVGYTRASTVAAIRALSISGTTVTIGADEATTGTSIVPVVYAASSSVALVLSRTTNVTAQCYTVSGSTLTPGSSATITSSGNPFCVRNVGARWLLATAQSTTVWAGSVISVSGTTPTVSTVTLAATTESANGYIAHVVGNQMLVAAQESANNTVWINVLTDTAGTASAGTAISRAASSSLLYMGGTATDMWIRHVTTGIDLWALLSVGISGGNPVVNAESTASTSAYTLPGSTPIYKSNGTGLTVNNILFNSRLSVREANEPTATQTLAFTGARTKPLAIRGMPNTATIAESDSSAWGASSSTSSQTRYIIYRFRLA